MMDLNINKIKFNIFNINIDILIRSLFTLIFASCISNYTFLYSAELSESQIATFKRLAEVKNLKGEFVQIQHLVFFEEELRSEGIFSMQASGNLHWEILRPTPAVFNTNTQDLEQKGGMAKVVIQQITDLVSGQLDRLKLAYDLEADPENEWRVILKPKSKIGRSLLSHLILTVDPKKNIVAAVQFFEPSGDWTQIEFNNIESTD